MPFTIKQYIETLQKFSAADPDAPQAALALNQLPQAILDKNIPDWQKINIIKGSISADNIGISKLIQDDHIDSNGRPVIGHNTLFAQNTSKPMVDELWRLSQGNKPIWESGKIWMDKEREYMVGNYVRQLNTDAQNPNIKFIYDTDSHSFRAEYAPRKQSIIDERGMGFRDQAANANETLRKINATLPSIVYVAEKEGQDPNAAILRWMVGAGLDPNVASVGKMLSAMTSATKVVDPFNTKDKNKNQDRVAQ